MAEKVINFVDDHLGLQIASCALLSLATAPILVGSFCSLRNHTTTTTASRRATRSHSAEEEEEKHFFHPKVITTKDTLLFPILISGFVYVVSSLTQTIHPDYLNHLLTLSTALLFTIVFSSTVLVILKNAAPKVFQMIETYHFSFDNRRKTLCHFNVTVIHILTYLISIGLSVTYVITQHWIIENLFAISIAIHSIRYLTLQSFGTGYLLLLGMLAYDLFWVFGTNTLVHLSKILVHAPTSVVWPRNINTYVLDKLLRKDQYFTMYGLGEIIIPGIFIAYTLKYDQYKNHAKRGHPWQFEKPYFTANVVAYVVGAAASIYTVHFTKKSQSAFAYIVPALLTATTVTALVRNEFGMIYDGSDILSTFQSIAGYTVDDEARPTFEERLRTPRTTRRSRSRSTAKPPAGVVTEAFEETRNLVGPYVEEAVEGTRKVMEPYIEEAVKSTKKVINDVATKVQETTNIEEDVVDQPKRRVRRSKSAPRVKARSKSVARKPRSTSRANSRKKA